MWTVFLCQFCVIELEQKVLVQGCQLIGFYLKNLSENKGNFEKCFEKLPHLLTEAKLLTYCSFCPFIIAIKIFFAHHKI